jgi:hypothetical protein
MLATTLPPGFRPHDDDFKDIEYPGKHGSLAVDNQLDQAAETASLDPGNNVFHGRKSALN